MGAAEPTEQHYFPQTAKKEHQLCLYSRYKTACLTDGYWFKKTPSDMDVVVFWCDFFTFHPSQTSSVLWSQDFN